MKLNECPQPWFEMQIRWKGIAAPCCYAKDATRLWDFDDSFDIPTIWNSAIFKKTREIIATNDYKNFCCKECQFLNLYDEPSFFFTTNAKLDERQKNNWEKAFYNYTSRSIYVNSFPVKYYFNFGLACNLRCIMCNQAIQRLTDNRTLNADSIMAQSKYLTLASEISVIGGEPFFIPEAMNFIKLFSENQEFYNVGLNIFTNGTLIHKYWDVLTSVRKLRMTISLDAIGNRYEFIRTGASWNTVEKNITEFIRFGKEKEREWNLNIASVIMKSSISGLVEYVEWCIVNELPCHFVPITKTELNEKEDIFSYPSLLLEIIDWEKIFNTAIKKLKKKGWISGGADALEKMQHTLAKSLKYPQ